MATKKSLILGAFAILALLIAGVSYWPTRDNSLSRPPVRNLAEAPPTPVQTPRVPENAQPLEQEKQAADASPQPSSPSTAPAASSSSSSAPATTAAQSNARNFAEAPAPRVQTPPENSPPIEQEKQAANSSIQRSSPSTAPAAPSPAPSAARTIAGQSDEPPTPPSSPSTSAAPGQSGQVASEKPPSAAAASIMPDEDKMSEANRRQVQEALHGLGYYDGLVDGIFGPLTRASIRRFQVSIGKEETGRLTAAEAGRLVSGTALGLGAGTPGNQGSRIPEAAAGRGQPNPADLPPQEQGNVAAPYNSPRAQTNARSRGGSKLDRGSTGNTGAYGQIPSICTGC